jgi:hypothetical protein
MEEISAPARDPVTALVTAVLREPSGNEIILREAVDSMAKVHRRAS